MIHSGHQLLYSPLSQLFVAELLRGKVDRGEALFRQKNNFRRGELNVFKILYAGGKATAQRGQARNFPIQRRCTGSEQRFQRGSVPRRKRRGNLVQRKPQIAQQADKMEISRLFGGITAITVAVHMDGAEQADAVVIDQHALFNGQHPGKFTGAEKHAESLLKKA